LIGVTAIVYRYASKPNHRFEQIVMTPIPASVRILRQTEIKAMDSYFWACRFQAGLSDIELMCNKLNLKPASDEDRIDLWNSRIQGDETLGVVITTNWNCYVLHDKTIHKYLYVDTNISEVIFVLDEH
jgi:hypothetical protein